MFSKIRRYPVYDMVSGFAKHADQNLSISPREIAELTARGISSSATNAGLTFTEGSPNPVLTIENTRGVDVADVWTASKDAASNLVRAHKKDKDYYG